MHRFQANLTLSNFKMIQVSTHKQPEVTLAFCVWPLWTPRDFTIGRVSLPFRIRFRWTRCTPSFLWSSGMGVTSEVQPQAVKKKAAIYLVTAHGIAHFLLNKQRETSILKTKPTLAISAWTNGLRHWRWKRFSSTCKFIKQISHLTSLLVSTLQVTMFSAWRIRSSEPS